jgi:hypothetical protein
MVSNPVLEDGSLITSLEFLLKVLTNEDSLAVDCFFMIGLMP